MPDQEPVTPTFIKKAVDNNNFWRRRIYTSFAKDRPLYSVIFDTDDENWLRIQQETTIMLGQRMRKDMSVIDVGCGYGAVYDCIQGLGYPVNYVGIDYSTDLIELANIRHPGAWFSVGDARKIPYGDSSFDLVICRAMRDMVEKNLGYDYWERIYKELVRVSRHKVLIFDYDSILSPTVLTK